MICVCVSQSVTADSSGSLFRYYFSIPCTMVIGELGGVLVALVLVYLFCVLVLLPLIVGACVSDTVKP